MNKLIYIILLTFSCTAIAESNSMTFSLPSAPTSSGTDNIRAGDLDCSNSIGGSTNFEMGFTGVINNATMPIIGKPNDNNPQSKD